MRRNHIFIRRTQRGFVVIAVIVVLAMAMALFGLWGQAAVREHRWLDGQALRIEATELAESGLARAVIRHAKNAGYWEETWSIPASEFHNSHAATVHIRVEPVSTALRYTATADYPTGAVRPRGSRNESKSPTDLRETNHEPLASYRV